ncbi:hypothetical protein SAMN05421690_100471 [Nitrosomonas sp. Nm51]|uniref:hypothetical protein n=1 Tax=Nitrosomonas sp. Nm51 TaxID=133720 RepID=UPI0008CCFD1C|nr:hypothetical protein [Nitrosomonas sp. Nm51]SEQ95770.1 hypothetical protein SAMN05421690_100471 [Nitrosomonas sp. Nm51]
MNAYQLLFNVTVEHRYFTNHACKSLVFVPTPGTSRLFNRPGLLFKTAANRLSVFFETSKQDRLHMYAEDGLTLIFKVFSNDANFFLYTAPAGRSQDVLLCFDNQQPTGDAVGRQLLHGDTFVSDMDYKYLNSDRIRRCLQPRDYHVPPCFIIQFTIHSDSHLLSLDQETGDARIFFISFASNRTFWKYYLMDDLSRRSLYIKDLDSSVVFEEIGEAILPGNHSAKILQSTQAIEMHERPHQRLQLKESLKESQNPRDRVLINRLPNASVSHMHSDWVGGKMEKISEIYVN